ncbi:MAG: sucrose phosphorylase [Oscillospiraceae bacterium]|nr:sucrose phosphorylase [Oscillospiraceae bacterium]MDY3258037.1 sucrose phosphorylase [Ruminococcus callidus]
MKLNNKIMLITYADSLGKNLKDLSSILDTHYKDAVGGVHVLPFFPSSADRGFAPVCYDKVDPAFGDFSDIEKLSEKYYLMFDFMVNHISAQSEYFKDFLKNKDKSKYKDMFIRYKDFWENGEPTQKQVDLIYKRKPRAPYIDAKFADGTTEKIWCTFCEEQIDLDVSKQMTIDFIKNTIKNMCSHGASVIRLDAFAYAIKKPDTNCFFVEPDIWNLLYDIDKTANEAGAEILPEIHEHYTIPLKIADKGFWIYDFALPVLTLHALYNHTGEYLKKWMEKCPMKQFTTLDTHDGIGIVDVKDLIPDEDIEKIKDQMYSQGANVKAIYNSEKYNNLDIYQVNTTYYSALGNNDKAYLLARAIQFFAPGIPQVYYVGMLAGANDIELLEKTKNGRDINRHYYSVEEVEENQEREVVKELKKLMILRNTDPAFSLEGNIEIETEDDKLVITRSYLDNKITLKANLTTYDFEIVH